MCNALKCFGVAKGTTETTHTHKSTPKHAEIHIISQTQEGRIKSVNLSGTNKRVCVMCLTSKVQPHNGRRTITKEDECTEKGQKKCVALSLRSETKHSCMVFCDYVCNNCYSFDQTK